MSDWYKMNPLDWNSGTDGLSLEQEAAYLRLCHAMYMTEGPIRDNGFVLCGLFRCNDRKAKRLLTELVSAGKITVENGLISNRRAIEVISERRRIGIERKSAAVRGGVESGKARAKALENIENDEANASPDVRTKNELDKSKIRLDKNTPSLRSGVTHAQGLQFSEFWELYPNKVGRKAAETAFSKAIRRVEFSDLMSGLQRYVRKTDDRQWCNPSTWLNQDRWGDAPALVQERTKGETDYAKRQRSFTEALESTVYGGKNDREFASSNSDIDFGPGDYRSY